MVNAYILIHMLAGGQANLAEAQNSLRQIPGVKSVHFLAGPTDAIAYMEVANLEGLSNTVGQIRGVKGIASTDTRLVMRV